MVQEAGQPEIFRAAQRDEIFQKHLSDTASEVAAAFFGLPTWIRWREAIRVGAKLAYSTCTTLGNLQTLGEEYTGVVHWTEAGKLPSKQAHILMILLECFGEKFLLSLITRFENHLNSLPNESSLRPEAKETLLQCCDFLRRSLPYLQRIHKSFFYLQGRYYLLSKRFTGVRYALVRFWLRDRSVIPTFRLLGAISLIHQLGTLAFAIRNPPHPDIAPEASNEECINTADQCSLCLNKRQHSSVTPCGHIYCWNCIVPWVSEQPFCPLCRQSVQPSRIVLLQNYS